jgi:predicted glycosyltransferase
MPKSSYNILMYSHDTYGLGHIRRTMAIARTLIDDGVNILILTGSPIVGRFDFPEGVDFVRIPGMIKQSNESYVPHSIRVAPEYAMNIRQEIITATAKAFNPALFIVDKAPLGLKREIVPTLHWFRQFKPETRVVLGLRDIMDDAASTRKDWQRKDIYRALEELYSEVWVYGEQRYYDPVSEYAIPDHVAPKLKFTGYIPRQVPAREHRERIRHEQQLNKKDKLVVVTTGGGGDGYKLLDTYLTMLETRDRIPFRTIMVSGPFLPRDKQDELAERAKRCRIRFFTFFKKVEKIMAAADLVVSMGGYNTICEILSLKKTSLIIPRETPRLEQRIRADVLSRRGVLEYLPWDNLSPAPLYERIHHLLHDSRELRARLEDFPMPGLEFMRNRLEELRKENS